MNIKYQQLDQIRVCNVHRHRPPFFRLEGTPLRKNQRVSRPLRFPCPYTTISTERTQYLFEALYLKYKEYIRLRIRESTTASRFSMIDRHILPFLKKKLVSDISPADVAARQNEMLLKGLSNTYLNQINIYLKAIFSYFEILYYTDMREGALLALTLNDINFRENQIRRRACLISVLSISALFKGVHC